MAKADLQVLTVRVEPDHEYFRDALRVTLINLLEYTEFYDHDEDVTNVELVDEFLAYREAQKESNGTDVHGS